MQFLDSFLLLQNHVIIYGGQTSAVLLKAGKALSDVIEIFRDILDVHPSGVQSVVAKKESRVAEYRRDSHHDKKKQTKKETSLLRLNLLLVARLHLQRGG